MWEYVIWSRKEIEKNLIIFPYERLLLFLFNSVFWCIKPKPVNRLFEESISRFLAESFNFLFLPLVFISSLITCMTSFGWRRKKEKEDAHSECFVSWILEEVVRSDRFIHFFSHFYWIYVTESQLLPHIYMFLLELNYLMMSSFLNFTFEKCVNYLTME